MVETLRMIVHILHYLHRIYKVWIDKQMHRGSRQELSEEQWETQHVEWLVKEVNPNVLFVVLRDEVPHAKS